MMDALGSHGPSGGPPHPPRGQGPPPQHGPGGFRRLGGKHGHGPPHHHRHQRRHLLHHGMDGHHHDHDHHGEGHGMGAGHGDHFGHGEEGAGEDRPHKCGGPLGFGSRDADMCLREARESLSAGCQEAMAQTETIFRQLNDDADDLDFDDFPPHHHIGGGMFILMLLSACLCRRCAKKSKRAKMKHVLKTLHEHPELKAAVEDAAGTSLPVPGWKCKMVQAINANPELKAAVENAAQMQMPQGGRGKQGAARKEADGNVQGSRCGRCCAIIMIVFSTMFLVSLFSTVIGLCGGGEGMEGMDMEGADGSEYQGETEGEGEVGVFGDEEAMPESDPLAGFFFSIFFGFLLIMTCSLCCKCLRCLYKQCCLCEGNPRAAEYPGAAKSNTERLLRREGTELTVVYVGLPASPEDVPALNKL